MPSVKIPCGTISGSKSNLIGLSSACNLDEYFTITTDQSKISPQPLVARVNKSAHVTCECRVKAEWKFNNDSLPNNVQQIFSSLNYLHIPQVRKFNKGAYKCICSSNYGRGFAAITELVLAGKLIVIVIVLQEISSMPTCYHSTFCLI